MSLKNKQELENLIATARATHDIRDVLGSDKKVMVCPLPQHQHSSGTPSFSVYWLKGHQWWKCHGSCNLEGDIVDLVGYLRVPGYDPKNSKMIREALALLDSRYEIKVVIPEKETTLSGHEWYDFLPPGQPVYEYAERRGIRRETVERFRLGQSGNAMTIPAFMNGRLTGVKFRSMLPKTKLRYWSLEGSRQGLFNYDKIRLMTDPILVVKAEIPCMILDQEGFLACAPTGGEGGWVESWRTALALAPVIVVGDNDKPGRILGERRAALLNGVLKFPPEAYKDIDQYYLADREGCLALLRQWQEEARKEQA